MNQTLIYKILSSYKKKLEDLGYDVIYIGLYGSQNYNLDDEESDIDAKAVVNLSFDDFIHRKKISTEVKTDLGNIDVKDILTFNDVCARGNIAYLEAIQTNFCLGDKSFKEKFKVYQPSLKSIYGQMLDKKHALTHEYPSKKKEFEKWGFDPKQLHHIVRLYDLLRTNRIKPQPMFVYEYYSYIYYLEDNKIFTYLKGLKRNSFDLSKEMAESLADRYCKWARELLGTYEFKVNYILNDYVYKWIERHLKKELISKEYDSVREFRTFDGTIPSKDLNEFPQLEKYKGKDITYTIYSNIEVNE